MGTVFIVTGFSEVWNKDEIILSGYCISMETPAMKSLEDGREKRKGEVEKEGVVHKGGCHRGEVRWEVRAAQDIVVVECDCSICRAKQNHHFIVPASQFELLKGKENLSSYTFNTGAAKHMFCSICGVQSFYIPRSNQDGVGVMPHCITSDTVTNIHRIKFNGANWEKSMEKDTIIKNMSKNS